MNVFLLDLWQDLREKKLWPLALVLLIAIVALPVVLLKPAEKTDAVPTAAAAQVPPLAQSSAAVALEDPARVSASRLDAFAKKDPFKPHGAQPKSAEQSAQSVAGSTAKATATTVGSGSSGTGSSGGGSTGTTTGTPAPPVAPTGGGTTTTPTGTNKGKSKGNDTGSGDQTHDNQLFTYAIGLRFGAPNKAKPFKNVQRLDLIPSSANPIAAFLGVSASGTTAVFLIQAGYEVQGEGQCRPSIGRCSFLYLRNDAKHDAAQLKAPDGTTYGLRLTDISQVAVKDATRSSKKAAARAARIRKARKHAGRKAEPTQPRFLAPVFGDVSK